MRWVAHRCSFKETGSSNGGVRGDDVYLTQTRNVVTPGTGPLIIDVTPPKGLKIYTAGPSQITVRILIM
jgi:hypothetical protein